MGVDVGVDVGADVLSKGDVGTEVLLLLKGAEEGKDEGAKDGAELLLDGVDVVIVSMTGGLVARPRGIPMLIPPCIPMLIPPCVPMLMLPSMPIASR